MNKMARGKSLCVFGAKGGTGKTLFTLNLAGVLSNLQKKVLIIDLDLYNGGIALALSKNINKTIYNFCDDYNNNRYEHMGYYVTQYNNYIDYISCPKDPRQANKIDTKYIDLLIDKCSFLYDVILIDTTHVLDEINVFTLDKVDNILFMITNDPLDLKNIKNVLTIMKENEINKYKVLLNNSTANNKDYFTLYDLKSIIDNNIDYIISSKFHVSNMDTYVYNGEIYSLSNNKFEDYAVLEMIAKSLIKEADSK